ncbi:hypothetical protein J6590_059191 [Homalodisca vitripennis]|nr:hypothetical protein J6590_059191 [Homalodisca vitripennis]
MRRGSWTKRPALALHSLCRSRTVPGSRGDAARGRSVPPSPYTVSVARAQLRGSPMSCRPFWPPTPLLLSRHLPLALAPGGVQYITFMGLLHGK